MGTRSLTSPKITVSLTGSVVNQMTVNTARQATSAFEFKREISFSSGVSLDQVNRAWEFEGLINSGGFVVIDLFDYAGFDTGSGDGDDFVGQDLEVEEIVAIMIGNENLDSVLTGDLEIIPDPSNGWTPIGSHTVATGGSLKSQGLLCKLQTAEAGFDITDASSHRIRLDANGGNVNYKIAIIGRHDDNESSSSSSSVSSSLSSSSPSSSSVSSSSSISSSASSDSSSSSPSSSPSSDSSLSSSSLSSLSSSSISSSSVSSESSSSSQSVSENSSSSPSSSSVP